MKLNNDDGIIKEPKYGLIMRIIRFLRGDWLTK